MLGQIGKHFERYNEAGLGHERVRLYRGLRWNLHKVPLEELGIWDQAQGMPHKWCLGNVVETAKFLGRAETHEGPYWKKIKYFMARSGDAIIAVDGRLRRGRERCSRTRWSIDDGCMRAVATAMKGHTHIPCYLGRV